MKMLTRLHGLGVDRRRSTVNGRRTEMDVRSKEKKRCAFGGLVVVSAAEESGGGRKRERKRGDVVIWGGRRVAVSSLMRAAERV